MTYLPQLQRILVNGAARIEREQSPRGSWRRRLPPLLGVAAVLAASGAAAAALVSEKSSAPPSGRLPVPAGVKTSTADVGRYDIVVTPALTGGGVGWCLSDQLQYNGGGGPSGGGVCGAPVAGQPIVAANSSVDFTIPAGPQRSAASRETTTTTVALLTSAQVAAARLSRTLTVLTRPDSALPDGYRIAITVDETAGSPPGMPRIQLPKYPPNAVSLGVVGTVIYPRGTPTSPLFALPLRRNGHAIPTWARQALARHVPAAQLQRTLSPSDAATYWQTHPNGGARSTPAQTHAPAGACEIYTSRLRGADPLFGKVVPHVHGFPQLIAKTFLSCAFTYLAYPRFGVQAAILLDAQHPGATPAPLPDATVVSRNPETVNEPAGAVGAQQHFITARRVGDAWLVVESTAPLATRMALLRRLQTCVRLSGPPCPAPPGGDPH
jgi:hypothetical protein